MCKEFKNQNFSTLCSSHINFCKVQNICFLIYVFLNLDKHTLRNRKTSSASSLPYGYSPGNPDPRIPSESHPWVADTQTLGSFH